jgi:glutamate formiminotransferase
VRSKELILATCSIAEAADRNGIDAIAGASQGNRHVRLLNVAPKTQQGRTLFTLAGQGTDLISTLVAMADVAVDRIVLRDDSQRIGVFDSGFFVPISGTSLEECKRLAKKLGKQLYQNFGIAFFYHNYKSYPLYEVYAQMLRGRGLAGVREGLAAGLIQTTLGDSKNELPHGFCLAFARPPSLRFNIHLRTSDPDISARLASRMDSVNHNKLWSAGTKINVPPGTVVIPEKFAGIKAVGVTNKYLRQEQIEMLLYDCQAAPMHEVFETVKYEADNFGVEVVATDIQGLAPLAPLLQSGQFYLGNGEHSEKALLDEASQRLLLDFGHPFVREAKIVEFLMAEKK